MGKCLGAVDRQNLLSICATSRGSYGHLSPKIFAMAEHLNHMMKPYHRFFQQCLCRTTAETLTAACSNVSANTDFCKIVRSCILESLAKTRVVEGSNAEGEGRHRSTLSRRIEKAVEIHLGSLFLLLRFGSPIRTEDLKSLREAGIASIARMSGRRAYNPLVFLSICRSFEKSLVRFPIIFWFLFLIRAALVLKDNTPFKSDDDGDRYRAVKVFRNVCSTLSLLGKEDESIKAIEDSISLFEMWEDIFPATAAYDPKRIAGIEAVWKAEQDGSTLTTPNDWQSVLYEDEKDWFPLARSLNRGAPSMSLSAVINSYKITRQCCVTVDDENDGRNVLSFVCYRLKGKRAQLRCSHLQMTLAQLWKKLADFASKIAEEASSAVGEGQSTRSFDEALAVVVSNLLASVYMLAATQHEDGRLLMRFHSELWVSVDWKRNNWLDQEDCEECAPMALNRTFKRSNRAAGGRDDVRCRKELRTAISLVSDETS